MKELTVEEVQVVSGGIFSRIAVAVITAGATYVENKEKIDSVLNGIGERATSQRKARAWQ